MSRKAATLEPRIGRKNEIHETRVAMVFILPWIVGFLAFTFYPICSSLYYSLCEYNVINDPVFIGLDNYVRLLTADSVFTKSLSNTMYMVFIGISICTVIAITLSVILNNRKLKGLSFFRVVFFLPTLVPVVIVCILWIWILQPQTGVLNTLLGYLGIHGPGWIASPTWAKPSFVLMMIWNQGGAIILYLAGLQDISETLYESASIDGANFFQKTTKITIPMLTPVILFNVCTAIIHVFQWFVEPMIITAGGPDSATMFYSFYLYQNAFNYFKMGYASAMAWILLLIALALIMVLFRLTRRYQSITE